MSKTRAPTEKHHETSIVIQHATGNKTKRTPESPLGLTAGKSYKFSRGNLNEIITKLPGTKQYNKLTRI